MKHRGLHNIVLFIFCSFSSISLAEETGDPQEQSEEHVESTEKKGIWAWGIDYCLMTHAITSDSHDESHGSQGVALNVNFGNGDYGVQTFLIVDMSEEDQAPDPNAMFIMLAGLSPRLDTGSLFFGGGIAAGLYELPATDNGELHKHYALHVAAGAQVRFPKGWLGVVAGTGEGNGDLYSTNFVMLNAGLNLINLLSLQ